VNCHCKLEEDPVRHVEPVQLVVQYLTQAAIKLPSASDNARIRTPADAWSIATDRSALRALRPVNGQA